MPCNDKVCDLLRYYVFTHVLNRASLGVHALGTARSSAALGGRIEMSRDQTFAMNRFVIEEYQHLARNLVPAMRWRFDSTNCGP